MSDSYGTLIGTISSNFRGRLDDLCDKLNRFEWSNDFEGWELSTCGDYIVYESIFGEDIQYPTAFPVYRDSIDVLDENYSYKRIYNPSVEQIELAISEGFEIFTTTCNLEFLTQHIAPVIKNGWIEIVSHSTSRDGSSDMGILIIDSEFRSSYTFASTGNQNKKSRVHTTNYMSPKTYISEFMRNGRGL